MPDSPTGTKQPAPIFIGGTGRSGTSILGKAFQQHSDMLLFMEPGIVHGGGKGKGIQGLVRGTQTPNEYREELLTVVKDKLLRSFARNMSDANPPGEQVYAGESLESLFEQSFRDEISLKEAICSFLHNLYGLGLTAWNKSYWVDKTPAAFQIIDILYELFPQLRFIHVLRDPKDVCSSTMPKHWGPDDVQGFISWYNQRMAKGFEFYRQLPTESYCAVSLENIVADPKRVITKLFDFVDVPTNDEQISRVISVIDPDKARSGRWRQDLTMAEAVAINRHCGDIYQLWKECELLG